MKLREIWERIYTPKIASGEGGVSHYKSRDDILDKELDKRYIHLSDEMNPVFQHSIKEQHFLGQDNSGFVFQISLSGKPSGTSRYSRRVEIQTMNPIVPKDLTSLLEEKGFKKLV